MRGEFNTKHEQHALTLSRVPLPLKAMSLQTLAASWISWLSAETWLDVAHTPIVSWSEKVVEKK